MKNIKTIIASVIFLSALQVHAEPAGGSAQNGSKAVKHSGKALSHTAASAGKAASAVVAIPLIAIGNAGPLSAKTGEALWDNAMDNQPLTITEKTITADPPPKQAINERNDLLDQNNTKEQQQTQTEKKQTVIKKETIITTEKITKEQSKEKSNSQRQSNCHQQSRCDQEASK